MVVHNKLHILCSLKHVTHLAQSTICHTFLTDHQNVLQMCDSFQQFTHLCPQQITPFENIHNVLHILCQPPISYSFIKIHNMLHNIYMCEPTTGYTFVENPQVTHFVTFLKRSCQSIGYNISAYLLYYFIACPSYREREDHLKLCEMPFQT